jgi:hypothetical protein
MDASRFDRLTRHLGRRTTRRTALGTALAGISLGALNHAAAGQATPATDATPAAEGDQPVFMFVQTAASGRGEVNPAAGTPVADGTPVPGGGASYLLTLEGHTGLTVYFSDRPDRIVGAVPTEDFLPGLGFTPGNPPNAALVGEFKAGQGVVVLQLVEPGYDPESGTLTYGAEVLDAYQGGNLEPVTHEQLAERLPAEFGPAALFIDDCPTYTSCMMEVWASFGGEPVYVGVESVGPIPEGPYKGCFSSDKVTCAPCDTTLEKLEVMCNAAYPDVCFGECFPGG